MHREELAENSTKIGIQQIFQKMVSKFRRFIQATTICRYREDEFQQGQLQSPTIG